MFNLKSIMHLKSVYSIRKIFIYNLFLVITYGNSLRASHNSNFNGVFEKSSGAYLGTYNQLHIIYSRHSQHTARGSF
jgi:hypothetical protein